MMTTMCQLGCVSEGLMKILPKTNKEKIPQNSGLFFHVVASMGQMSSLSFCGAQGWRSKVIIYGLTPSYADHTSIHSSSVAHFFSKKAVFTQPATSDKQESPRGNEGTDALPGGMWGPSLSYITWPATLQMPGRHKKFIKMLCVCVCLSQFLLDKVVKPAVLLLQLPVRKSFCGFCVNGHVDTWRATEAGEWRRGAPLAGWAARERDNPAGERTTALDCRVSGPSTAASTPEAVAGCAASSHPGLSSTWNCYPSAA